jgi:hypothetical protein
MFIQRGGFLQFSRCVMPNSYSDKEIRKRERGRREAPSFARMQPATKHLILGCGSIRNLVIHPEGKEYER